MPVPSSQSRRLREYTNVPFEIFVVAFTVLPFLVLAYFYPLLPNQIPLFLKLNGDVAVWGEKNWLSVFRVPLMAVVTQVVCLLMKYGLVQSGSVLRVEGVDDYARLQEQYLGLNVGLWDWFRCLVAFKMSAASLDTIFLSVERFRFLSQPAFAITFIAAVLSIVGALYYSYRLLSVRRKLKEKFGEAKTRESIHERRVYGGVLYFNPGDPALFVRKYLFNIGNKWVWVFFACIIAYSALAAY